MVNVMWTIGLVLFFLSIGAMMVADACSTVAYHSYERAGLVLIALAGVCFVIAIKLT